MTDRPVRSKLQEQFDLPHNPESVLKKALEDPEVRSCQGPGVMDRLMDGIWRLLERLLSYLRMEGTRRVPGLGSGGDLWPTIVHYLLIGSLIITFGWLGKRLLDSLLRRVGKAGPRTDPSASYSTDPDEAEVGLRERARRAVERGDYRTALILDYRLLLHFLAEKGLLVLEPGMTNREIVPAVTPNGVAREILLEIIPVFNRVRYGDAPCDRADYLRFRQSLLRVMEDH
ncbi:MAG: DUF4129 domain-containing protein [Pseudomonadota bacterium]